MNQTILADITETITNLQDGERVRKLVEDAIASGISASEIVENGLRIGMEKVGNKFSAGEYFLSELLFASSIMNDALDLIKPELNKVTHKRKGMILLGTVRGDAHDIGKNIFKMLAISGGYEVEDLDVDVDTEEFVRRLIETKAQILAMSALLTTVLPEMANVIDRLKIDGLRKNVRVLIGGNAVTKKFAEEVGADGGALDAVEGVRMCDEWTTD